MRQSVPGKGPEPKQNSFMRIMRITIIEDTVKTQISQIIGFARKVILPGG